jgi:hypothetical protein
MFTKVVEACLIVGTPGSLLGGKRRAVSATSWDCFVPSHSYLLSRRQDTDRDDSDRPKQLDDSIVYVISQAEKMKTASCFGSAVFSQKTINIMYTEASIEDRMERTRGAAVLPQHEQVLQEIGFPR